MSNLSTMKTKSQSDRILRHLQRGHGLTPIQALNKFGVFRLGARIFDLKRQGWPIFAKKVKRNGKTFAHYSIPRLAAAIVLLSSFSAIASDRCYDAYEDPLIQVRRESAIRRVEAAERQRQFEQRQAELDAWLAARRAQRALDEQTRLLREQNEILRKSRE